MGRIRQTLVLRRPAQVAVLASPVRTAIVDILSGRGPCSIGELSAALGQRRESLYYHVSALRRHGLVVLQDRRKGRRRPEAVYALAAPRLQLDRAQRGRRYRDAVVRAAEALLRVSARDFRAALGDSGCLAEHPVAALSIRRLVGSLDQPGMLRLNDLLHLIDALFRQYAARGDQPLQALTLALVPIRKSGSAATAAPANRRRRAPLRARSRDSS